MSRVMWQFGKRQWFFLAALALGAVYGVCFLETQTLKGLSGGFAHAFPAEFSARALFFALLFQGLPCLFFFLSGFFLFGREGNVLLLSFRCALSGCFVGALCKALPGDAFSRLWAVTVLAFEALSLCCLNSMARLGELYLAAAKKGVRRKATLRYAGDQLFFTGLVFLFYLLRGVTMRLLTS